jgi:hypothetical protein
MLNRSGSQIRGEIHHFRSRLERAAYPGRGGAMGERAEYERASFQFRVVVGNEANLVTAEVYTLSPPLVRRSEVEAERRVSRDEGAQLAAGIAGRTEHPDRKFMHAE